MKLLFVSALIVVGARNASAGCMPCYDYCPTDKPKGCCGGTPRPELCEPSELVKLVDYYRSLLAQRAACTPEPDLAQVE